MEKRQDEQFETTKKIILAASKAFRIPYAYNLIKFVLDMDWEDETDKKFIYRAGFLTYFDRDFMDLEFATDEQGTEYIKDGIYIGPNGALSTFMRMFHVIKEPYTFKFIIENKCTVHDKQALTLMFDVRNLTKLKGFVFFAYMQAMQARGYDMDALFRLQLTNRHLPKAER